MFKKSINRENIINEQIEFDQALDIMERISKLMDKDPIPDEEVIELIKKLPKNNALLNEKALKDNSVYMKFKQKMYEFILYENILDNDIFEILNINAFIKNMVANKIAEDVENLYEFVPIEIQRRIADVVPVGSKIERYFDDELMQLLYKYKFEDTVAHADEDLKRVKDKINELEKDKSRYKSKIKKLWAKITLWAMLAIPVYSIPVLGGVAVGHAIGKSVADEDTYSINGESEEFSGADDLYFSEAIPEDYEERNLQYITEYTNTENGKVMIKVYDYNDVIINKAELQTMGLDESRLVYCNVFKKDDFKPGKWDDKSHELVKLGNYTGENHRDLVTYEHTYSIKTEFDKTIGWGITFAVIFEGVLIGTFSLIAYTGWYRRDGVFIFPIINDRVLDIEANKSNKADVINELKEYKAQLNNYQEKEYARVKVKRIDMIEK